ncbi:hypothetical protein [Phyllobacterium sp. SB3]|uniref:hypothetical protein n=1 Tax=Phyllobacterium sp. SB3 TaxID=3156073 RepID=UPI0032AFD57A
MTDEGSKPLLLSGILNASDRGEVLSAHTYELAVSFEFSMPVMPADKMCEVGRQIYRRCCQWSVESIVYQTSSFRK